jgi:hypothetical protein
MARHKPPTRGTNHSKKGNKPVKSAGIKCHETIDRETKVDLKLSIGPVKAELSVTHSKAK